MSSEKRQPFIIHNLCHSEKLSIKQNRKRVANHHTSLNVLHQRNKKNNTSQTLEIPPFSAKERRETALGKFHGIPIGVREVHIPLIANKSLLILSNELDTPVGVEEQPVAALDIIDAHLRRLTLLAKKM